jgi:hypothetical protein
MVLTVTNAQTVLVGKLQEISHLGQTATGA